MLIIDISVLYLKLLSFKSLTHEKTYLFEIIVKILVKKLLNRRVNTFIQGSNEILKKKKKKIKVI